MTSTLFIRFYNQKTRDLLKYFLGFRKVILRMTKKKKFIHWYDKELTVNFTVQMIDDLWILHESKHSLEW